MTSQERADDRDNLAELPRPYPGTPRWVKVFAAIAIVVALLLVALMVGGGADRHGPGRHLQPANTGEDTQPAPRPTDAPPAERRNHPATREGH